MVDRPRTIAEPARTTPVLGEYEVVVLGGGPSGLMAATAAARAGRSVILVERYGFLGGMGTAAGVTNFCGLYANVHGEIRQVVHGITDEFLDRIDRLGGLADPALLSGKTKGRPYDTAAFKMAADDLLVSSGAKVLFHALATAIVKRTEREVEALIVETKSGRGALIGKMFIDCSGDGDLAAWAGAPFEKGDASGNTFYPSTMFRINAVDPAKAGNAQDSLPELMLAAERSGKYRFPRKSPIIRPQKNRIEWRANLTQLANPDGTAVDATNAEQLSRAEIEGRRQIKETFQFLRQTPGFENSYIVDIAPQVGIRETRRIMGDYQLSGQDVLDCASFEDTIGVNGWMIEMHVSGDIVKRWQRIPESRGFNHLPYRMLLPVGLDNVFAAGRCASMSQEGQSAARVSGGCFVMGQAAGTAADFAIKGGGSSRAVRVSDLQQRLASDGAYLGTDL